MLRTTRRQDAIVAKARASETRVSPHWICESESRALSEDGRQRRRAHCSSHKKPMHRHLACRRSRQRQGPLATFIARVQVSGREARSEPQSLRIAPILERRAALDLGITTINTSPSTALSGARTVRLGQYFAAALTLTALYRCKAVYVTANFRNATTPFSAESLWLHCG